MADGTPARPALPVARHRRRLLRTVPFGLVAALACGATLARASPPLVDAPAGALPALTEDSLGVALFDLDKDGDLDLYLANFGIEDRVYLNDGAGVFTDASALVLPAGVTVGGATAVTAVAGAVPVRVTT